MSTFQRPRSHAHLLVLVACVAACLIFGLSPRWSSSQRGERLRVERALIVAGSGVVPGLGLPLRVLATRVERDV